MKSRWKGNLQQKVKDRHKLIVKCSKIGVARVIVVIRARGLCTRFPVSLIVFGILLSVNVFLIH